MILYRLVVDGKNSIRRPHRRTKVISLVMDSNNEKIYLYWMAPGAESQIQEHSQTEEVAIVQGSLYWLNEDKNIKKKLKIGDYVDRKPGLKHGSFKSGPNGRLMYVRFH